MYLQLILRNKIIFLFTVKMRKHGNAGLELNRYAFTIYFTCEVTIIS